MTPRWASVVRVLFDALSDIANGRASLRLRDPNNVRLVAEDAIVEAARLLGEDGADPDAERTADVCHHLGLMTCYAMLRSHRQLEDPVARAREYADQLRAAKRGDLAAMIDRAILKAHTLAGQTVEHLDVVPDLYAFRPGAQLPDVQFRAERAPGQLAAGPDARQED